MTKPSAEVFISYAWDEQSQAIVALLEKQLGGMGLRIVRDVTPDEGIGYKGLIKDFMDRIGNGSYVIVVISDRYLRSRNCMYELTRIAAKGDFYDRVFPIVMEDAKFYAVEDHLDYLGYWDQKIKTLGDKMAGVSPANRKRANEEIDLYHHIRTCIDDLLNTLAGMNTLSEAMHRKDNFNQLYEKIREKMVAAASAVKPTPELIPPKQKAELKEKTEAERRRQEEEAKKAFFVETVKGVSFRMIRVEGGSFKMGDVMGDHNRDNEKPVHRVTLSGYYIGEAAVTVREFKAFVEAKGYRTDAEKYGGSYFWEGSKWENRSGTSWRDDAGGNRRGENEFDHPVLHVSWKDAVAYCKWLSNMTGKRYRLPTEAEWEYAARERGRKVRFGNGKHIADPSEMNFDGSEYNKQPYSLVGLYREGTTPVKSFSPNRLGLYDMSGNVWECCSDWYDEDYYQESPTQDPQGPATGSFRVIRGGSWGDNPLLTRVAYRSCHRPAFRNNYSGFRLALSL